MRTVRLRATTLLALALSAWWGTFSLTGALAGHFPAFSAAVYQVGRDQVYSEEEMDGLLELIEWEAEGADPDRTKKRILSLARDVPGHMAVGDIGAYLAETDPEFAAELISTLEAALPVHAQRPSAWCSLGQAYQALALASGQRPPGLSNQALQAYQRAVRVAEDQEASPWYWKILLANELWDARNPDRSAAELRAAVDTAPLWARPIGCVSLGQLLLDHNLIPEAAVMFMRSLREAVFVEEPDKEFAVHNADALCGLAAAWTRQGTGVSFVSPLVLAALETSGADLGLAAAMALAEEAAKAGTAQELGAILEPLRHTSSAAERLYAQLQYEIRERPGP